MLKQDHKLAGTAVQSTGGCAENSVVFLEEPLTDNGCVKLKS